MMTDDPIAPNEPLDPERSAIRRVVFLDIDGVLQRHGSQLRFDYRLEELRAGLAEIYGPPLAEISEYDIGATIADWDADAVERLRALCVIGDAAVVVSSAWREYQTFERLKSLFRLHRLDPFVVDVTPQTRRGRRDEEIALYLEAHPHIENFVVLDDASVDELSARFGPRFVYCREVFGPAEYRAALAILTGPA